MRKVVANRYSRDGTGTSSNNAHSVTPTFNTVPLIAVFLNINIYVFARASTC